MKKITTIFMSVCLMLFLAGCGDKYKEEDFIGKTSLEIVEEYGPFDCVIASPGEDGLC